MYKDALPSCGEMLPRFAFYGNAPPPAFGEGLFVFSGVRSGNPPRVRPSGYPRRGPGAGAGGPDPRQARPGQPARPGKALFIVALCIKDDTITPPGHARERHARPARRHRDRIPPARQDPRKHARRDRIVLKSELFLIDSRLMIVT